MTPGRRFRRSGRKTVEVILEPGEIGALVQVCRDLSDLLDLDHGGHPRAPGDHGGHPRAPGDHGGHPRAPGDDEPSQPDDPVLKRLFPPAYLDPTEEKAEADWQRFTHHDLVSGRRQALGTVIRSLDGIHLEGGRLKISLSEEGAQAWLSVLNDARLALGTRLEVTEDLDFSALDPDDPDTAPYAIYWWLGYLEEDLIEALSR